MRALHLIGLSLTAFAGVSFAAASSAPATTSTPTAASPTTPPLVSYDAELAQRVGADERGMRKYVLVILKSGPERMPDGLERDAMFAGHFANIGRLAKGGKLVVAGPFGKDPAGWRGLYIFAVADIAAARALTATDPVVVSGEMVAEYHERYGSAATMLIPEWHERLLLPVPTAPAGDATDTGTEEAHAPNTSTPKLQVSQKVRR